jgi:hypothetical protein
MSYDCQTPQMQECILVFGQKKTDNWLLKPLTRPACAPRFRGTTPSPTCEFATLRERLMRIGARIIDHLAPQPGLQYQPDFIAPDLLRRIRSLTLQPFQLGAFEGKRRVVSLGWRYDYSQQKRY